MSSTSYYDELQNLVKTFVSLVGTVSNTMINPSYNSTVTSGRGIYVSMTSNGALWSQFGRVQASEPMDVSDASITSMKRLVDGHVLYITYGSRELPHKGMHVLSTAIGGFYPPMTPLDFNIIKWFKSQVRDWETDSSLGVFGYQDKLHFAFSSNHRLNIGISGGNF